MPEQPEGPEGESGPEAEKRHHPSRNWSGYAAGLAVLCLLGSALAHVFGLATPSLNLLLMAGIVVAGTAAWLVQARQVCPGCGRPYGYRFRFVNARICRHCGGEFDL